MSKTKFRSLGVGFLLSAIILALVTVAWPFVPDSLKSQLDSVNLPIVSEQTTTTTTKTAQTTTAAQTTTQVTSAQATTPVTITVESGDVSSDVANKLQAAGAITDAQAFVDYLVDNNIAENILVGTFEIQPNASFEQIARELGALR